MIQETVCSHPGVCCCCHWPARSRPPYFACLPLPATAVSLKNFQVHAVRIFHEDRVRASAEVHDLSIGGDDIRSGRLHLTDGGGLIIDLDGHRGRARVANAQMELGARNAAELSELDRQPAGRESRPTACEIRSLQARRPIAASPDPWSTRKNLSAQSPASRCKTRVSHRRFPWCKRVKRDAHFPPAHPPQGFPGSVEGRSHPDRAARQSGLCPFAVAISTGAPPVVTMGALAFLAFASAPSMSRT